MKKIILIFSIFLILLSGCGYKEGVSSAQQESYIFFSGNTNNVMVSIDSGKHFSVESGKVNQYSVKPGKHLIEVYKNGSIIVKREIFLGDGVAKEIGIK